MNFLLEKSHYTLWLLRLYLLSNHSTILFHAGIGYAMGCEKGKKGVFILSIDFSWPCRLYEETLCLATVSMEQQT